jgi:hypothetical protein
MPKRSCTIGVTLFALCAAACGSAGHNQSAATTTSRPPTPTTSGRHPGYAQYTYTPVAGVVTGYIEPCVGIARKPAPFAAGTVTAFRNGSGRTLDPQAPKLGHVVARQHVTQNHSFQFVLAPGDYALRATYDEPGIPTTPVVSLTARPGTTLHVNVGTPCK